jgi:hypothetical protein
MKKCRSANRYRGYRAPVCNLGDPCDACKATWRRMKAIQAAEVILPYHVSNRDLCGVVDAILGVVDAHEIDPLSGVA